jgi:hypothetical protein
MLPDSLKSFRGRIIDVDSHENMPAQVWVETFGEVARPIAEELMKWPPPDKNAANYPGYPGDVRPIEPETIWSLKGPSSPAAWDMNRREAVLDALEIRRQLMFPTSIGMWGSLVHSAPPNSALHTRFGDSGPGYAAKLFAAYNTWAVETAKVSKRLRPVAPLYGETPDELYRVCEKLIAQGVRAFLAISSAPPGGVSPAHSDLDRFYSLLEEANACLTVHIGGQTAFMKTTVWGDAPIFDGFRINEEINMSPWRLSTIHLAPQNFIAALVTGAVFDRHPRLRVGAMEFGAHWIGPLASLLDLWHDNNQSLGLKTYDDGVQGRRLPMRPSEYIARNVRVAPFDFEPVNEYVDRFGLEEVYCFASDYPHVEGGKDPMGRLSAAVGKLGDRMLEKFFVTNGELLLAD